MKMVRDEVNQENAAGVVTGASSLLFLVFIAYHVHALETASTGRIGLPVTSSSARSFSERVVLRFPVDAFFARSAVYLPVALHLLPFVLELFRNGSSIDRCRQVREHYLP